MTRLQQHTQGKTFGWGSRYTIRVLGTTNHQVDVEIQHEGRTARLRLALPSSQRPMPWLTPLAPASHVRVVAQRSPTADDWVYDLLDLLSEEMDTGGIAHRAVKTDCDGNSWLIMEGYGLRVSDPARHCRLRSLAGPDGFFTRGRKRIRLQYALQWALDQVETQLSVRPDVDEQPDQDLWQLTSTDGFKITVHRTDHDQSWDLIASHSHPCSHQTAKRRLSHP